MQKLFSSGFGPALAFLSLSSQAFALSTQGGIDPQTGMTSFLTYAMPLAGTVIVGVCAYKGVHATAEGRSVGPAIAGVITGTGMAFGGATLLTKFGVN